MKENNVRVSVIGLAAEVRICHHIAKETGGEYNVLLDDHHLKQLILNLVQPPLAGCKFMNEPNVLSFFFLFFLFYI